MTIGVSNISADGEVVLADHKRKYLAISNNAVSECYLSAGTGIVAVLGSGLKLNKSGVANDFVEFQPPLSTIAINAIGSAAAINLSIIEI